VTKLPIVTVIECDGCQHVVIVRVHSETHARRWLGTQGWVHEDTDGPTYDYCPTCQVVPGR